MQIVTGYTGRSHITPALDASINTALFGNNNVVLNFGDKLSFSSQTRGKIVIGSGALCFSGRIAVSENSEEKEYVVPSTGDYSHCKIVARYEKITYDGTNTESISLVLLQSTEFAGSVNTAMNLYVGEYENDTITDGTTGADFVLYDFVVSESGVVTVPVEAEFTVVDSIVSLAQSTDDDVVRINNEIDSIKNSVNTNTNSISTHNTSISNNLTEINANKANISKNATEISNVKNSVSSLSTTVNKNRNTLEEMIEDGALKRIPFNKSSTTYEDQVEYVVYAEDLKDVMYLLFKNATSGMLYVTIPVFQHYMNTQASGGVGFLGGVTLRGAFSESLYAVVNVYGGSYSTSGTGLSGVPASQLRIRVQRNVALGRKNALSGFDFYETDDFPVLIAVLGMNYS